MGNLTVWTSSKTDPCYRIIARGSTVSKNIATRCNRKLMFNIYSWIQRLISPDTSLMTKEIPVNFYSATKFRLINTVHLSFKCYVRKFWNNSNKTCWHDLSWISSPPPQKYQVLSFWCKLYLWKWWPEKKRFPW